MKRIQLYILTALLFLGVPSLGLAFGGGGDHQHAPQKSAPALPEDYRVQVRVPVFSEHFADTPVALVDGQPVLLGEIVPELQVVHDEMPLSIDGTALTQKFNQVLDRLISERAEGGEADAVVYADRSISKDRFLTVHVPVFSPHFVFTPVATVNDEPIPMGEFSRELGAMHAEPEMTTAGEQQPDNPTELLDRLVIVRLVEQEARNMGIDQQGAVQRQVANFAEKTLLYELLGRQVKNMPLDQEQAQSVYQDISLAAKLESYHLPKKEDADALKQALEEGGDFDALIAETVEKGKATPGEDTDYVPFKDLLSQIAGTAKKMELGEVSPIFRVGKEFVVFKLIDRKFVEDPEALGVAEKITWDAQVAQSTKDYIQSLIDEYAAINEQARKDLDFARIKEENPDFQLSDALLEFFDDRRTLATVVIGEERHTLSVQDVVEKLKNTYFHGTEIDLNAREADERTQQIIDDWILRLAGTAEAEKMGIDESLAYTLKVEDFERRTLFDHFMQKVVLPDVNLSEEEIREYYDEHQADYSTPAMLRLKSLAFSERDDALDALSKLQKGSDFNWVSANAKGLVPSDDRALLDFGKGILSLTSLPEEFQKSAADAQSGDSILYTDPKGYHYVIYFDTVYPPEAKPYDQVRSKILETVFQERVQETLMAYVEQLKEHYPTHIYLKAREG